MGQKAPPSGLTLPRPKPTQFLIHNLKIPSWDAEVLLSGLQFS